MTAAELPHSRKRVKFGDVVRKVNDRVDPETSGIDRYVAGEHMDTDGLRLRRWGDVGDGYLGPAFHMRFKPGHVLYGSRRTYLRKVAIADFDGICANTTFVLEPNSEDLLPEFLPHLMSTEAFHEHSIKQSKGSVNPYINFSDLTWYELALPPIEEQRRIGLMLRTIDDTQAKLESALERSRVLHAVTVDNCISHVDSLEWKPLTEVCLRVTDGPFGSKIKSEHYRPNGARVVRLQNIGDGEFLNHDEAFIDLAYYEDLKGLYGFKPGDLVVAGLGDERNTLGRAAAIPEIALPATNKADCFLVRPGPLVAGAYLLLVLNSSRVLSAVKSQARGTTRARVSSGSYKNIKVPVPGLPLQKQLVESSERVLRVDRALKDELVRVRGLRKGILNREVGGDVQ